MIKNKVQIHCFLFLVFVLIVMAYFAFVTVNCLAYPWWVGLGSDGDGIYLTQTLSLINNGPLEFIFHPGATVYGFLGIMLRLLSAFDPAHLYVRLGQMQDPSQVFAMLDGAIHISRIIIFILNGVCLLLLWRVLFQLSKDILFSLGLAAFFMTTYFMLYQRVFILRPEIFSFMFCLFLFSYLWSIREKGCTSMWAGMFQLIICGALGGFALLAKVQSITLVGSLLLWGILSTSKFSSKWGELKTCFVVVIIGLMNLCIMPWGWCNRPAFLLGYLKGLYYAREEHQIYGLTPITVAPVYLSILTLLLVTSILVACWRSQRAQTLTKALLKVNLFITGMILAGYAVFIGLGLSTEAYHLASNNLLYALTTGLMYGGVINHRIIDADTFKAIIAVHADNKILGVGILWFIGAAVGVCVFRILQCKKPSGPYWLALSLFALGLGVDILSTFRQYTKDAVILVSSYAIYSLSIHCCGLAILFFQESEALKRKYWGCDGGHFIRGLLVVHVFLVALYVLQMQKWDVKNSFGQTPSLEMQSTMAYVPGFWHMVSQGRI